MIENHLKEIEKLLSEIRVELASNTVPATNITQYDFFTEYVEPRGAIRLGKELGITKNFGYRLTKAVETKEQIVISADVLDRVKRVYNVIIESDRDRRGGKR